MNILTLVDGKFVLTLIGALIGGIALGRWSYQQAIAQAASGWKELAEVRAQDIDRLKTKIDGFDKDFRQMVKENEQLRSLNLKYQLELTELRERVRLLEPCHELRGE